MDELQADMKLASEFSARWRSTADKLQDELADIHKWILASCLSVNGGGVLFALNATQLDPRSRFFASIWFCFGLIVSIVYAILFSGVLSKAISAISEMCTEMDTYVSTKGSRPNFDNALKTLQRIHSFNKVIIRFQLGSLFAFVVGVGICGYATL